MIPVRKLETLPRSQKLRKILRIVTRAELRLAAGLAPAPEDLAFLEGALGLLPGDPGFSPAALSALEAALGLLPAEPSRSLNTIRHILLAETGRAPADWDFVDHRGRLDPAKRRVFPGMRAYLEDIRSPFNVGAMFRTAESFGVEKLYLSPLCADPLHRRASRTAMGAVDVVPWERIAGGLPAREPPPPHRARAGPGTGEFPGGPFFALETGGSGPEDFEFPRSAVMIAGSEELGVSPEALELADSSLGRLSIPVYGAKGSLNVSVAFGIALHAWAAALL
ncbi:MAG: TrmH family RNA methyltransferase [Treponema sp.]|jgi:TrmH family RNA methyltransferase|nr:TrmH family RNA methyltransferase [Treponema sp.]